MAQLKRALQVCALPVPEGMKYGIRVNVLAPAAWSRLTEDIFPQGQNMAELLSQTKYLRSWYGWALMMRKMSRVEPSWRRVIPSSCFLGNPR